MATSRELSQQTFGTMGWCIVSGLAVAVTFGVGKLVVDLKKYQPVPRRKKPWELG